MIGQTISHYRVVSQLGVGGMGVVYEGLDPRLGRPVAIKFVPEELSHDLKAMERLRGEARTASGLNHPNICTIYDVGEHEGRPFIVMELLRGQTLRDRIASKPMKMHEAVDVGIQVADALDVAHTAHIIHRDIKPANLFIVDRGQVKVLDFGLAKLLNRDLGTQLTLAPTIDQTAAGIAMGTVAYMSPEQVQGEDLDNRTDLFSLGVVLYECVTGRQPFTGKTSAVVFSQILTQAPVAPIALNPEVPSRLQDVINNCLEKDREMRYQEAASLRADLKRVKRDLESGAASVAVTGSVSTRNAVPGSSGARTTVSTPIESGTPSAGTAAPAGSARNKWVAVGVVVAGAVAAGTFLASRDGAAPQVASAPVAPVEAPPPVAAASPATAQPPAPAPAATIDPKELEATIAAAAKRQVDEELQRRATAERAQTATDTPRLPAARQPAPPPPSRPAPQAQAPAPTPVQTPAPEPQISQPAPSQPAAPAVRAAELPAAVASAPPPAVATTPPPRLEPPPERRTPSAASAEDDEAAIRRVVANYARAIETKNLALYREVKPNLTPDETRRIEAGFGAVTSQRVTITVDSIERRGQEAVVRLRRHDVIQAGGRQQSVDSQQTMTFTHASGTWVIRDIR